MTNFTVQTKQDVSVKYLLANMGVRYWEDGKVNGVEDDDNDPKMPLKKEDAWVLTIDLETGKILDWPDDIEADAHYKVCDAGIYSLLDTNMNEVVRRDGYVPAMLSPGGDGYGDYVIMKIDKSGVIENWSVDLDFFNENEDS